MANTTAVRTAQIGAVPFFAGKNKIINGDFGVWQRGTSTSIPASTYPSFPADRWITSTNANQACTVSRQATGDTTNLPNLQYAIRYQRNSGQTGTGSLYLIQNCETATTIPYAGKTITLSFYARKGANYSATSSILVSSIQTGTGTDQNAFLGYTGAVDTPQNNTLTTTWQRFTQTLTLAATTTEMAILFLFNPTGTAGAADYYEITGVQVEAGSTATAFQTATGTVQGELAACQRYFYRITVAPSAAGTPVGLGLITATTTVTGVPIFSPVTMRTAPTFTLTGTPRAYDASTAPNITAVAAYSASVDGASVDFTSSGLVAGRCALILANTSTSTTYDFSSEL